MWQNNDYSKYDDFKYFFKPYTIDLAWLKRKMPRRTAVITFGWLKKWSKP